MTNQAWRLFQGAWNENQEDMKAKAEHDAYLNVSETSNKIIGSGRRKLQAMDNFEIVLGFDRYSPLVFSRIGIKSNPNRQLSFIEITVIITKMMNVSNRIHVIEKSTGVKGSVAKVQIKIQMSWGSAVVVVKLFNN
ncbi:hypothetical protein LIER_29992 [Lithospermum erythrorhizon]|uniref:Uncharacterized protein n=1 Tax=Lithospermum erythrorhizon TaxID=34254 RepID=A0AAV3RPS6_LITER